MFATGELYNLNEDVAESRNVAASHPTVVAELNKKLDAARKDLCGGSVPGAGCRPVGKAKGPLRFWIPRHADSGHPPQAPVHHVPGSPVG